MAATAPQTPAEFTAFGRDYLPGHAGIRVSRVELGTPCRIEAEWDVSRAWMSPNDCLHGGAVSVLADTTAGYGAQATLPPGASGFLTVEMKSNLLRAVRDGTVACLAQSIHLGRTTQVWDAVLTHRPSGRTVALFRCTQLILYPESGVHGRD